MAEGQRNLSFYLSPRALRVIAVVAPVLFAVFIGLLDDRVLEPRMSNGYAHAITTAIIGVAAFVFTTVIFGPLGGGDGSGSGGVSPLLRKRETAGHADGGEPPSHGVQ